MFTCTNVLLLIGKNMASYCFRKMPVLAILSLYIFIVNVASECDNTWQAYKDEKCFKFFDTAGLLSYQDAENYCSRQSASLISIGNEQKQDFIGSFLQSKNFADNVWIGLKYTEDSYRWSDYVSFSYSNWGDGSPKNVSDHCVQIQTDEEDFGKWSEVLCNKKNAVFCEKLQLWSATKMQAELMNVIKNPVPIGFIYVQLPEEKLPVDVWPGINWEDITLKYAGVFFRAEGGNSSSFGSIQDENSPRLISAKYNWNWNANQGRHIYEEDLDVLANNKPSKIIRTGVYKDNTATNSGELGLNFTVSGGEVRPRNMAIRIWKRIE